MSDEAVQAALDKWFTGCAPDSDLVSSCFIEMHDTLTAALPHLVLSASPCSVEAKKLPCDVQLPGAIFKRGVSISTLITALERREYWPDVLTHLPAKPVDVAAVRVTQDAIVHLTNNQKQLDADGCMVGVSREALETVLDAIRALSPAEPVDQWQDIATAPKDGGTFLAVNIGEVERWHTTQEGVIITVKANDRPMTCTFYNDDDGTPVFTDEFGEVYTLDGVVCDAEGLTAAENVLRLTFWMPLPAAPTSKGGE